MVKKLLSIAVLCCVVAAAGTVSAQEAPGVLQLVTIKIKPGGSAGFEEWMGALRTASQRLGIENYWLVAQSVSGEPSYTVAIDHGSWAELADPGVIPRLAEAFGEREAERLYALSESSVESVNIAFYNPQPDLSVPRPEMEAAPDAIALYELTINPNMGAQYAAMSAATREAAMAVEPDLHYEVLAPGPGATGVLVIGIIEHWADLDEGLGNPGQLVIQHFGQAIGAAINARAQETISNIALSIHRTRPDLSYQPEE